MQDFNYGRGMVIGLAMILILILIGMFVLPRMASDKSSDVKTEMVTSDYYTIDENGNLIDPLGKIIAETGTFYIDDEGWIYTFAGEKVAGEPRVSPKSEYVGYNKENAPEIKPIGYYVDVDGNLVDKNGNIKVKAGEYTEVDGYYVDKEGNRLGRILGKFAEIVKNAADDVAQAFKDLFEKEENKGTSFTLQKMEWNPENHRIEDYSVPEIEALAKALQEHPEAKISVQAHTDDAGDKNAENKNLTNMRAKVVENMLTTLGVDKKQISSKGMGGSDPAKASKDVVEILVRE